MYPFRCAFLALGMISILLSPCRASPVPLPALSDRHHPHHPTIPNALPNPPNPPRRDTDIFSGELVAYLDHMQTKSPVLLEDLVNLLQDAWKAQMDFLAWYEIIKVPLSARSVPRFTLSDDLNERAEVRDVPENQGGEEERALKWLSPGEKARWAEECRWLLKVARKVTFNFELPASPLAMFPGSDEDICTILEG